MTTRSYGVSRTTALPTSTHDQRGFTVLGINAEGVTQAGISSTAIMGVTEALSPIVAPLAVSPRLIAFLLCVLIACLGTYEGEWRRKAASYVLVVAFLFTGAMGANKAASEIKSELTPRVEAAESAPPHQQPKPRRPFDPW